MIETVVSTDRYRAGQCPGGLSGPLMQISLTEPVRNPVNTLRHELAHALARCLVVVACCASPSAFAQTAPLPTVASVDLNRYVGTWYEIAKLPNFFQRQCLGDVSATYRQLEGGNVEVLNRCRTSASGEPRFDSATGVAKATDPSNAKLRVSFLPPALRWLPVGWGDYQVIELDPEYRWVVVGEPRRDYLWVLSRTPALPPGVYESLMKRAAELGFPVDKVVKTQQGG
jgi:apolipoprotein D and lipocalin family protein